MEFGFGAVTVASIVAVGARCSVSVGPDTSEAGNLQGYPALRGPRRQKLHACQSRRPRLTARSTGSHGHGGRDQLRSPKQALDPFSKRFE
jgi:hypothetical protein